VHDSSEYRPDEKRGLTGFIKSNVHTNMTHPYSIYIWQPPLSPTSEGIWIEPVQAYTQQYTLYVTNLIHQDTRSVIKVGYDNDSREKCHFRLYHRCCH
jgi:hypothetical protein